MKPYTGEGKQIEEDHFDRWLQQFKEGAKIAGWSVAQQLHQLKLLLGKTALRVFRVLPDTDRSSYKKAMDALHGCFKLVDIEELRGLEFHHKVQGDKSVEELGMVLQELGRKAFSSSHGREFDGCSRVSSSKHYTSNGRGSLGLPRQRSHSKNYMIEPGYWSSMSDSILSPLHQRVPRGMIIPQ